MDYLALSFFIAYLIGSIPFGLVLTKLTGHGDIRKIGSGNIGATNVLRTGNKSLALATLVLDGAKGAVAVWLIYTFLLPSDYCESVSCADIESCHCMYGEDKLINIYVAAFAAIIGHCFPAWLK